MDKDKSLVQAHKLLRLILANPEQKLKIIQDFVEERSVAGDHETAELVLIILNILMANPQNPPPELLPKWFLPLGLGLIMLFLMGLVIASIFGLVVPPGGRFALVALLAIGCGLSASALGGKAAIQGKIPFFHDSPLALSATSGIALLIIVFVIGYNFYIK
jgi:hypothetical protein